MTGQTLYDTPGLLERVIAGPTVLWEHCRIGTRKVISSIKSEAVDIDFPEAQVEYFPGPGYPTFVIIWTPTAIHVFEYHSLEYILTGEYAERNA